MGGILYPLSFPLSRVVYRHAVQSGIKKTDVSVFLQAMPEEI